MWLMTNVILITVDCLRADHLKCLGYHRNTSPFLDDLSKKSLFCTHAFANGPNTRHSVPSFLSSTPPLLFNQEANGGRFHPGRKSIAEVLKSQGFSTGGIHSNPYVSAFYGYNRGFDYFNDFLLGQVEDDVKKNPIQKKIQETIKGVKALVFQQLPHETAETVNKEVFRWLEGNEGPFFLWVHYMDVHMPYVPPNSYLKDLGIKSYIHARKIWMGKKIDDVKLRDDIKDEEIKDYINLFDGTIRYTDEKIKELIDHIEKRCSDTLFIITADHGEEFREHGGLSHGEKLYDELIHVPLFLYGKMIDPAVFDTVVSLLDVAPTILDVLNVKKDFFFWGNNLLDADGMVFSEAYNQGNIISARTVDYKLIVSPNNIELYDLNEDPSESKNIYQHEKDKSSIIELKKNIEQHVIALEKRAKQFEKIRKRDKIKQISRRVGSKSLK